MIQKCRPRGWYVGERFGLIVVKRMLPRRRVLCLCDCGREFEARANNVTGGRTKSCGCRRGIAGVSGDERTRNTWKGMRYRCENSNDSDFPNYGGRGICVCERWQSYENFLADMGYRPDGYSIERIDVDGDYEPSNCMWIPHNEQGRNQRRSRRLTYQGRTECVAVWAKLVGLTEGAVRGRLASGWSVEEILDSRLRVAGVKPKLTKSQILEVRAEHALDEAKAVDLARRFGVSERTVRTILKREYAAEDGLRAGEG